MEPLWANSARRDASTCRSCWLVLGLLSAVGCNSGRQLQTDLYQRELRLQEDEIYRLEDCLEEYQAIVRDYRCELAELKQADDSPSPATASAKIEALPEPADTRGSEMLPEIPEPLDLGPPAAADDLTPDAPGLDPEAFNTAPAFEGIDEAPPFEGAQLGTDQADTSVANTGASPDTSILVPTSASRSLSDRGTLLPPNPYPNAVSPAPLAAPSIPLSETIELGVQNGPDQTLIVRVAERSAAWLARFDGQASVMLTDPSVEGQLRRIARWDFSADEVRGALASPGAGPAELVMPIALPTETPVEGPLRLWVRLIDAEGNKTLQATAVHFQANPLRLASPTGIASAPRRLPRVNTDPPYPLQEVATVALTPESVTAEDAWRPAQEARRRRIDPAIQTVSFDSPVD